MVTIDIPSLYSIFLEHPEITTDTRKINPRSIFFALKGTSFDGNAFAYKALEKGASYAVVSDPGLSGPNLILVEDTLLALQSLANYHRRQRNVPVLAITGSNGKTTTKELVTAVLSRKYKVHATRGNLNNHIGVPLTLLGIGSETEFVVCEMGANHVGEIAQLCTIAEPSHGLITNIGLAHLEGFGSPEGVKKAKGELFAYLRDHHGFGFVNADDPGTLELGEMVDQKTTFGFSASGNPEIHFSYAQVAGGKGFMLTAMNGKVKIQSSMFGYYNASNMLAAYAVGKHFDVAETAIIDALSTFVPGANRSEIIRHQGCLIVKDAYNANPSSMALAVRAFAELYPEGWIVIGDMKELGAGSHAAHQQIIDLAKTLSFERVYLVGNSFLEAYASSESPGPRFLPFADIDALKKDWQWEKCAGKTILLKGSRSMQIERLIEQ